MNNHEKIIWKDFSFLKDEQRYLENKLNILGASIISADSFLLIAINSFISLKNWQIAVLLSCVLLPIVFFLIGVLPLCKSSKENKHFNIFSRERVAFNEENFEVQINYQIQVAIKVMKWKKLFINLLIVSEFFWLIILTVVTTISLVMH